MKDGKVPIDLAFCRWLAVDRKVMIMPNSLFYKEGSEKMSDKYVRIAICKSLEETKQAIERLQW